MAIEVCTLETFARESHKAKERWNMMMVDSMKDAGIMEGITDMVLRPSPLAIATLENASMMQCTVEGHTVGKMDEYVLGSSGTSNAIDKEHTHGPMVRGILDRLLLERCTAVGNTPTIAVRSIRVNFSVSNVMGTAFLPMPVDGGTKDDFG